MIEVRGFNWVVTFGTKEKALEYLTEKGKEEYCALFEDNKELCWKSPTGLR